MSRTGGLIALTSSTLLVMTIAMAPGASGTSGHERQTARLGNSKVPPCKPTFTIVSDKRIGTADTDATLFQVAEAGKKHAYAVGAQSTNATLVNAKSTSSGLLDEGQGTRWRFDSHPGRSLRNVELLGVAATSNHNVWADGLALSKTKVEPVVLHKTASGWHSVKVPGTKPTALQAVISSSPDNVYVAGVTESKKGELPVVLHYDGRKWRRRLFPKLAGFSSVAMTLAGHTPVMSINETEDGFNATAQSVVEYVKHGRWRSLNFPLVRILTSLSGSSIHDLWATSDDTTNDRTLVFHHTDSWHGTSLADNEAAAVSERTAKPKGVWFAGQSSDASDHALVDIIRDSSTVTATMEVSKGTTSALNGIDASVPNRVIAVGEDTTATGSFPLIYQATC